MKSKNPRFDIIYYIVILFFVVSSGFVLKKASINAHINFTPFVLYRVHFFVLFSFGVMLGLECLFHQKKKDGKWKLNFLKLIILGIPSLLIIIWIWFPLVFGIIIIKTYFTCTLNYSMFFEISVILFGWVLTTSIYKENLDEA